MQCDTCNAWVHTKCAGVEKDVIEANSSIAWNAFSNEKKDFSYILATAYSFRCNSKASYNYIPTIILNSDASI